MPRGTRENIINAFFRCANKHPDLHHFTISEIAKEAGISRQAVQRKHYVTVEELILDIRTRINDDVKQKLSEFDVSSKKSPYLIFAEEILPIIYDYRDWLKVLCTTCMDPNWTKFIENQYIACFSQFLVKDVKGTGFSQEFVQRVVVKEIFAIVTTWLSEELPEPPQSFSKKFLLLTSHSEQLFISPEFWNVSG